MFCNNKIIVLFLILIYSVFTIQAQNDVTLKGKKVLFVYGGWDGHQPKQCKDLFVPWMQSEGADVIIKDNLDCYTDEELMGCIDLVIQIWTMGTISNEQEQGLLNAVRNGVGLAVRGDKRNV